MNIQLLMLYPFLYTVQGIIDHHRQVAHIYLHIRAFFSSTNCMYHSFRSVSTAYTIFSLSRPKKNEA